MSILSVAETDNSTALAKQLAGIASSHLDVPAERRKRVLQVPLENLFRLSEMLRYEAFADEQRRGVLALESPSQAQEAWLGSDHDWSAEIQVALTAGLSDAFGCANAEAIDEFQAALREIATADIITAETQTKTRRFLERFQAELR